MDNTNTTGSRHRARKHDPRTQGRSSALCALAASVVLLLTGSAVFAQGDSSNLLTGWSCDSDGDGMVENDDYVRIEISGGGTVIGETTRRVEEGDEIVIQVVRTLPVSLADCDVNPATPWVIALRLTRVATTGASERVPDSLLYERRVEIHRDQQTFTLRIPTSDNKNTGKDTKIDVALVATSETDSRIILDDAHLRVEIWDVDVYTYYFDIVCDAGGQRGKTSISEADGVVEVDIKVNHPPEYDTSVLLVNFSGTAVQGSDFDNRDSTTRLIFVAGDDTETLSVRIVDNEVLEDTEMFRIRMYRNGLLPNSEIRSCTDEDGNIVETIGNEGITVTIIDDDTARLLLGPKGRDVYAGETVKIVGALDPETTICVIPFSFFVHATASGALENVLHEPNLVPVRWSHCTSTIELVNVETRFDDCNDNVKTVRYQVSLSAEADRVTPQFDPRVTTQHDEYIVNIYNRRPDFANSFTTGPNPRGYALETIDLSMHSERCSAQNAHVSVWSSKDDGTPRASQWGLRRDTATGARHTAPRGARLAPNTKYWVVVGAQYASQFAATPAPQPAAVNTALDGWTFGTVRYDRYRREDGNGWRTHGAPNPFSMAIGATALEPAQPPAPEPADGDVEWKSSLTVGNWHVRSHERERGWRVQACVRTRVDISDIEDHSPDDICYGRIGNRTFTTGSQTYTLEGVYHFVAELNDSLEMAFTEEIDFEALRGRSFIVNGETYKVNDRHYPPRHGRKIVWAAQHLTAIGGWEVGSTIWLGLEVGTASARAATQATVTKADETPVTGPFGIEIEFNEIVTDLEPADLVLSNAALDENGLTKTGERVWTAQLVPRRTGTVSVHIAADAVETDGIGNAKSNTIEVEADLEIPAATLSTEASEPITGPITVRVTFSKAVTGFSMTDLVITGGVATGLVRPPGENWREVLITPNEGVEHLTVSLPADAVQDSAGRGNTASATLEVGTPEPRQQLTAQFKQVPVAHDAAGFFSVELHFSENIPGLSYRTMAGPAFEATNSTITGARRMERGKNQKWVVNVRPAGPESVTLTLAPTADCTSAHAICSASDERLASAVQTTVPGPATLSVADARAHESDDGVIDFVVSLNRAALRTITVAYATRDGSAKAGEDYTARSGTLTFNIGEDSKTVQVDLLDDAKDEDEETFDLVLSNATNALIGDATATGTIENDDPLQRAWLARFGRTVGSQAADAVGDRVTGDRATHVTIAGQPLAVPPNGDALGHAEANARAEGMARWLRGEDTEGAPSRALTGSELLLGSAFSLSSASEPGGPQWGAWGRFATSSFDGKEDAVSLSGDVTSAFLGADIASGRWLAGVALGRSEGDGPFGLESEAASNRATGIIESELSAIYPYVRFSATERLDLWAMEGYGSGTMTVTENGGTPLETDIGMAMGAIGMKGTVLTPPPEGGLSLSVKSDALFVRTTSDAVHGDAASGGNLEAAEANVSRLRLVLEGSRAFALEGDGTLTPAFEVGVRHDGGDAETGAGIELGARLRYTRPGVTVEGAVRGLVAHEEAGYEEWGASGAIRIDPGTSGRGLSFRLTPSWGHAGSAAERLWGLGDARGLAPDAEVEAGQRLDAELGYGVGAHPGVVTPFASAGLADGGARRLRLGARWALGPATSLNLEGTRLEAPNDDEADHRLGLTFSARW